MPVRLKCVDHGADCNSLFGSTVRCNTGDSSADGGTTSLFQKAENFIELALFRVFAQCWGCFIFRSTKVSLPRGMYTGRVLLPLIMHCINVVGACPTQESLILGELECLGGPVEVCAVEAL